MTKLVSLTACTLSALLTAALFDTYVVAGATELRVNPFLGLERRYSYSDITEIATAPSLIAPNGNLVHRRVFLLKFADGNTFSTDSVPEHELQRRTLTALIEVIIDRTGIQPIEKAVFRRGEL